MIVPFKQLIYGLNDLNGTIIGDTRFIQGAIGPHLYRTHLHYLHFQRFASFHQSQFQYANAMLAMLVSVSGCFAPSIVLLILVSYMVT